MSQNHTTTHEEGSHGSYGSYIIGFVLSVILTVAAFAAALSKAFSFSQTLVVLGILAAAQVLVQLVFFLHMGAKTLAQRQALVAFLVAFAMVFVLVVLFVWVEVSANALMM